jgi:hypothetical protein
MDFERLNDFSRGIAGLLFAKYPHWRTHAKVEQAQRGAGYLSVQVPAPASSAAAHGLTVSTEDEVVTVGFDWFHTHFYAGVGDGERLGTDYAFHFIEELLSERFAVISWWQDDQCTTYSTTRNGKNAMPDDLIGPHNRVRIRSWHGALNEDRAA